jgi:ribonuclease I
VAVCGVLVLETGLGSGNYAHSGPVVHGIWTESSPYGNSQTIAPYVSSTTPTTVYPCYIQDTGPQLTFEQHEWTTHGVQAGICDADDFFTQVCGLAAAPLACMTGNSQSMTNAQNALITAGYEIEQVDNTNMQFYLSACRDSLGVWHLAAQSQFATVCA